MELPDTLTTRQQKAIRDWAAIGVEVESDEFWELWQNTFPDRSKRGSNPAHAIAEKRAVLVREAEGVLFSLFSGNSIEVHKCKSCGREFATNYRYNRHCSDECLAQSLSDRMGFRWDPDRSAEDRWKGEPPTIISPDTLETLKTWAKQILELNPIQPARDDLTINTVNDSFVRAKPIEGTNAEQEVLKLYREEDWAFMNNPPHDDLDNFLEGI